MKIAVWLLIAHAVCVAFSLAGMLIALPYPGLWADSPTATWLFSFGMRYAGSLHVVVGAIAVFAFGAAVLGLRKTLVFAVSALVISLACELIGTGTGWPFGAYEYTDHLGAKILGRVPFSIPLSWFALGLTSYVLAYRVVHALGRRARGWLPIALGVAFLTVWDLVLDPAMAHESLPLRFWIWHRGGPYFGMPLQNFLGWTLTGAAFITVSRWLWGEDADPGQIPPAFPVAMYAINMLFAVALSVSVGLWTPVILAVVLGVLPALLALREVPRPQRSGGGWRTISGTLPIEQGVDAR